MQILGNRSGVIAQWISVIVGAIAIWSTWPKSESGAMPLPGVVGGVRPYLLPILFASAIVLAALLHFIASRKGRDDSDPHGECNKEIKRFKEDIFIESQGRKRAEAENESLKKSLAECESYRKHWEEEVGKAQGHYRQQMQLREDESARRAGRISELEQQLQVGQAKADDLEQRLSTPRGYFRLKTVRYIATASRHGGDLVEAGKLPEKDLKEFFEDRYMQDGKLVIPPGLYRKLFGRQNDPLEGVPKVLEIRFIHAGNEMSVLLPENIGLTLPFPYTVSHENMT